MFGSDILDVAIGLVLVFLLVSLVLTAVQEAIEQWLRLRAGDLNQAIFELLQRDEALFDAFYKHPLVFALNRSGIGGEDARTALSPSVIETTVSLWARKAARGKLPSYIPRETFAAVVMDLFATSRVKDQNLTDAIEALRRLSNDNPEKVRAEIEGWYDGAMDRASGWFKRRTQKILFWLGLASAVVLNINAVTIGNYLATDKEARIYAARYAEQVAARGQPTTETIDALYGGLQDSVGLPIGWSSESVARLRSGFPKCASDVAVRARDCGFAFPRDVPALALVLAGYLITAFAAMLGAPFWFDALNRIMVIRATVKPKEKSPDEPSEDGGRDKARDTSRAGAR